MSEVSNGKREIEADGSGIEAGEGADDSSGLLQLSILSLAAGAVTGLVVALYRICLDRADRCRHLFIDWAHQWNFLGLVLVAATCAFAAAVAAWLVRRLSPHATGGGIPHVE